MIEKILLAVFLILYGLFHVTNLQVAWGEPIMGFAALVAGIVLLIRALTGRGPGPA